MIFVGGRVYAPDYPGATALVSDGSMISFVGSDDAARRAASGQTEVDLRGRLVTPAFVDAHVHLIQTGLAMAGLGLHDATSREDAVARLAAYARSHPDADIIVGHGWDERRWPEPLPPSRAELDRAGGGVPVYLARVDVHSAVVSSALLDQLPGVSSVVGYHPDGLLTREAHHLCRGSLDRLFTDHERRSAARTALHSAAAQGVAAVHDLGGPHLGPMEDLRRVREVAAELGIGVTAYWGELATEPAIEWAWQAGVAGLAGDLCVDGAIGSRTASLQAPYADADTRGARYLSEQQIADHVIACTQTGLQAGFHCIGDDAVAAAVSGLRRAAERLGASQIRAARHRLEHVEMISEADITTLAQLGVVASVQPAFDAAWGKPGELYEQRLGSDRARATNRFATMAARGVPLAFGTDAPVTPLAGWATVRAAMQHWQPSERLSATAAFDAATRGPSWAAFADNAGTITVGALANLAVWDLAEDGLVEPEGLPRLDDVALPTCAATISAGQFIYESESFSGSRAEEE
ncbi:MAG TPA: amidohydrolase [Propionibacteriaceae bacterium]|nr:amidohydrolase [Propionibacteriaceae bacterium]